jgi:hypothetical protein
MADFRGIGAVSATLHALLADRMELPAGTLAVPVTVSAPPEDVPGAEPQPEGPRVNLFLYRVTENATLKNQEIPGHGSTGAYGHPPLSLVLHYLVTAYGTSAQDDQLGDERIAHDLLGSAMRVLHDFAIIDARLRRVVFPPVGTPILDPVLLNEFERVKLCLDPVSLDDLTKLWTALERRFRLSAAYTVSVVQIESRQPRRFPRPVGEPPAAGPRVFVVPLRTPEIREIRVRRFDDPQGLDRPYAYARVGDTLVLVGHGFTGTAISVEIGGVAVPPASASEDRLEVAVPDTMAGAALIPDERRLQPGAHPVAVVLGVEGLPQAGMRSNHAVFMLVPYVSTVAMVLGTRRLRIDGQRLIHGTATGEMVVGQAVIPRAVYLTATPTQLEVVLPDTLPAAAVRCLVSGDLSAFPALGPSAAIGVTIGADGPHPVGFRSPATLAAAPGVLEPAIRSVRPSGPGFRGARVTSAGAAGGTAHLVIVAGGLTDDVVVADVLGDMTATQLLLTVGTSTLRDGYLSGPLAPFPSVTAATPRLQLTIAAVGVTAQLAASPTSLSEAAAQLQDAIRQAAPADPVFARALVAVLGNQLLIVPGAAVAGAIAVRTLPGVDDTTAVELQLAATYLVRVRVNGAESLDEHQLALP